MSQLAAQSDSTQLHRVVDAYQRTYSGDWAGNSLSSVIIKGTQTHGDVSYDFLLRKKEPNSIRFRLSNADASIICGYNGRDAWKRTERDGQVEILDLKDTQLANLRREADFYGPLIRYNRNNDVTLTLLGTVVVNAQTAYKIRASEQGNVDAIYYIGTAGYYLLRRELLDDTGAVSLQTDYKNYRMVGGFPFAFEIVNIIGTQQRSVTMVDSVQVNPGQLSFYFQKPTY